MHKSWIGRLFVYLCDIGNTNAKLNHNGKIWSLPISQFQHFSTNENLFYINVNEKISKTLEEKENFVNLEPYFDLDTIYQGMGIDRIAVCTAVEDGVIVDAGSAITVDIMSNGVHLGGFILPGLVAYQNCFSQISPVLSVILKTGVDLDALPQDTVNAVSYGTIKPIIMLIEENRKDKQIFFTGGDGAFFSRFFENSIYDKALVFHGMKKIINMNFN